MPPPPPATKKRKTDHKLEEITFDLTARQDYLTGFHKRKVQRTKVAQEKAVERARQERVESRKKLREERKLDLERHVKAINDMLPTAVVKVDGGDDPDQEQSDEDEDGWGGLTDVEPEPIDHHAEYIDEDKYTTVTVEAMDVTKNGLVKVGHNGLEDSSVDKTTTEVTEDNVENADKTDTTKKRPWTKAKPKDKPHKPKKKRNFRYEGKLERKVTRIKQRRKNSEQAKARKAA